MACSLPNSMRSNSVTLGTHENEFRNDGSSAARLFEHLPKHALAWRRSPSNLPCSLTATGSFCCLNRETASRLYGAETCAASLRRMLRLGYARTYQLTGQRLKEKLWPLIGLHLFFFGSHFMDGALRGPQQPTALLLTQEHLTNWKLS